MADSCLLTLVLLTIIKILRGDLSTCNYVYTVAPPFGNPIVVGVCREIVANSVSEWRKYICNGSTILDEVYDSTADCKGNVVSVETPQNIVSHQCGVEGAGSVNCEYVLRKRPCTNNPTTYNIEPIPTLECIKFNYTTTMETITRTYQWVCDYSGTAGQYYTLDHDNCTAIQRYYPFVRTACPCVTGLCAEAISGLCKIKVHGPTTAPTAEPTSNPSMSPSKYPTVEPTSQPSMEPTKITSNPSTAPSTAPTTATPTTGPTAGPTTYSPTTATPTTVPTAGPTTYSPTTAPFDDGSTGNASRIHVIANIMFVTFMVTFIFLF